MGVAEHVFDVDLHGKDVTWHLFDVGGARGQRHTWVPYFDDANAIIFLAPISAFDQVREKPLSNLYVARILAPNLLFSFCAIISDHRGIIFSSTSKKILGRIG